jgi:beta-mannosidase
MRIVFVFLLLCSSALAQTAELSLDGKWKFRKAGDKEWLDAVVPGTVHTDLLNNRKIPDPFYGTNEQLLQWIEDVDWEYKTIFNASGQTLKNQNVSLVFEGLDTYAKVFLNDSLILSADNMFRTWTVDCKKYLREKDNELRIVFESATKKGEQAVKTLPYLLPGEEKVFTRKAQYQYGWDWGPRFVTCGIWRPVKIVAWNEVKIENVQAILQKLTDSVAQVKFVVEVSCTHAGKYDFAVTVDKSTIKATSVPLSDGIQYFSVMQGIKKPVKWWPNGVGAAKLYSYSCTVSDGKKASDEKTGTIGLRTVELVQEKDTTMTDALIGKVAGSSFYFKVNGIPVFMKGANWIPADNFLPRVTKEKYRELLTEAKNANMNMLRVWGGGVYEDDEFYRLCDSLGIMVWQDFMFACAMYPGDSAFTDNVVHEVTDNMKRLRNHPCIALWCGNNEIDEGWNNWGWQKEYEYNAKDSAKIWSDYKNLFEKVLPNIVKENDNRSYVPSSPMHGWGRIESLREGDSHYWGIWWGGEFFEIYERKVGRFMSEYGFQGMPSLSSIKKFCSNDSLSLTSASMKNHQKHPTGFETIDSYLNNYYRKPKDFESYVYVSQLLQAEGIKKAIEAHRRGKPGCMGTLYWQYNDCWPVTSWSSMDYYLTPKALQYFVQKAFSKYNVSGEMKPDGTFIIKATSDDTATVHAMLRVQLIDFTGNILKTDSGNCTLTYGKSEIVFTGSGFRILKDYYTPNLFMKMELRKSGNVIADNIYYFQWPKLLTLHKEKIDYSITASSKNEYTLTLSTAELAKNVFLDFGDAGAKLSDNFFDLLPKEQKTVKIISSATENELKSKLKIKSLVDTYE